MYRVSEIHSSKREAEEVLKKLPCFQDAPDPKKRTPLASEGGKDEQSLEEPISFSTEPISFPRVSLVILLLFET